MSCHLTINNVSTPRISSRRGRKLECVEIRWRENWPLLWNRHIKQSIQNIEVPAHNRCTKRPSAGCNPNGICNRCPCQQCSRIIWIQWDSLCNIRQCRVSCPTGQFKRFHLGGCAILLPNLYAEEFNSRGGWSGYLNPRR